MDLNIARQPGQKVTPEALVRARKRADAIFARMVAEETYLDGATAYTAPDRPAVGIANAAADLRLPAGGSAAAVLDAVAAHFAARAAACHALDASEAAWPGELAAEIERRGFGAVTCGVYVLSDYVPPQADPAVQVIPGRAAYGELRSLYETRAKAEQRHDDPGAAQIAAAMIDVLDDPRIDVFLARTQRKPVGIASLLTLGNIGVVHDLFAGTGPNRETVLATLAARLFDHCQRAQFEQVIVRLDAGDPHAGDFAALGFKPVTQYVRYVRQRA